MRWTPGNRENVEDLRGRSGGMRVVPMGIGGVLVLLLLSWATGVDFLSLAGGGAPPVESVGTSGTGPIATSPEEEKLVDFVDAVMEDTQRTWRRVLGDRYQPTRVRLFRDAVNSEGCGFAQAASGPFYCPGDHHVYLDLGFFRELQRFGAAGDFAQAYVISHEVGHHVQSLTGIDSRMREMQSRNPSQRNELSVKLELQADCFAGVWGHDTNQSGRASQGRMELESGDIEEGLRAAAAIGDDRIQRMSTGRVFPDKFTHGSSAQRVTWFRRGFERGDPEACDTFQ